MKKCCQFENSSEFSDFHSGKVWWKIQVDCRIIEGQIVYLGSAQKKVGCYTVLMSVLYILRRFLLKQSQYGAWCVWLFDEKIPRKTKEMSFWSWEKKARLGCLQSRLYYSYYCHLGYRVSKLRLKNICRWISKSKIFQFLTFINHI